MLGLIRFILIIHLTRAKHNSVWSSRYAHIQSKILQIFNWNMHNNSKTFVKWKNLRRTKNSRY